MDGWDQTSISESEVIKALFCFVPVSIAVSSVSVCSVLLISYVPEVTRIILGERLNGFPRLSLNARNVLFLAPFFSRTVLTW